MKKLLVLLCLLLAFVYVQKPGEVYTAKNRLIAWFKVRSEVDIEFDSLSSRLSEAEIRSQYAALNLDCGPESSSDLGDRSCYAPIRAVNEVPAWRVVFIFERDRLAHVKLDLVEAGYNALLRSTTTKSGQPKKMSTDQNGNPIVGWLLEEGVLTTNAHPYDTGITQFLWISKSKLLEKMLSRN